MFQKLSGDVRVGYIPSALTSEFVVYGNREETLAAIRNAGRREIPPIESSHEIAAFLPMRTAHGIGMVAAKYLSS